MKFLALSETFKHILKNDTVLFNHWIPKAHVEIKELTIIEYENQSHLSIKCWT